MDEKCKKCWKPLNLCICAWVKPVENQFPVIILQHPQESRNPLTTARLISLQLLNCDHRIGLNWRKPDEFGIPMNQWAVLYLGSLKESQSVEGEYKLKAKPGVTLKNIKGIILLDGNWKQAKTLWWRNAWLLKANRILLNPSVKSKFDQFRKQPRENSLSTIESLLYLEKLMGEKTSVQSSLSDLYEKFLGLL